MAFLLDTHVLLWAQASSARLSKTSRAVVTDRGNHLAVSAASAWEVATKHRIGKLPGAAGLVSAFDRHLDEFGAVRLSVSAGHALLAGGLDWGHPDPFDRMLAAQCLIEGLTLVTRDPVFDTLPGLRTLW